MANLYYIEVTDTYGGEANYSWVTRHIIKAKTMLGAAKRFGRLSGMSWRCVGDYGCDQKRYDSKSGASCYFIQPVDDASDFGMMRLTTDDREGV